MTPKDPTLVVLTAGRRGGRPPAPEPGSRISSWVPAKDHDRLIRLARARGVSVSSVIRGLVTRKPD